MILKASYLVSLSLALTSPLGASAGYNCGSDYTDAISNCDLPCPSMLGYSAGAVVNECPEHKAYCYKTENSPDDVVAETSANEAAAGVEEVVVDEQETNTTDADVTEQETIEPELNSTETLETDLAISSVEFDDEPEILEASEEDALPDKVAEEDISPSPTTEFDKRRNMPNTGNHFCAIGWNEATIECENNLDAIPCPPDENGAYMSCPTGTYCYGIANCVRATPPASDAPTPTPTTYAPTTESPSSNPITADDAVNFYFCGSDLADANENCGTWCRYGSDEECPEGQVCHLESTCNATALNFTIDWDLPDVTESPSAMPTTYAPTVDNNPEKLYCSESWLPNDYVGDCGIPCPK